MYSLRAFIWVVTPWGFIWQFRSWSFSMLFLVWTEEHDSKRVFSFFTVTSVIWRGRPCTLSSPGAELGVTRVSPRLLCRPITDRSANLLLWCRKATLILAVACPRLSDTGEGARKWREGLVLGKEGGRSGEPVDILFRTLFRPLLSNCHSKWHAIFNDMQRRNSTVETCCCCCSLFSLKYSLLIKEKSQNWGWLEETWQNSN